VIRRSLAPAVAAAMILATSARSSNADEATRACAGSFEQSQYLQKDHKLAEARTAALACGASTCPAFVRDACQKLLADIDAAQPTIVLAAQDAAGADLSLVRVLLDGQPFVDQLGAEAVRIDPGEHTLRFVFGDGAPIEQHVLIRVAEKNRLVKAVFPAARQGAEPSTAPPAEPDGSKSGSLWPSLVVGALGLGTIGASIALGASAKSEADDLRATCAPRCAHADVSGVNTRLVVSDVLLGGGIAIVGAAAVLFILRGGSHEAPALKPVVALSSGGLAIAF